MSASTEQPGPPWAQLSRNDFDKACSQRGVQCEVRVVAIEQIRTVQDIPGVFTWGITIEMGSAGTWLSHAAILDDLRKITIVYAQAIWAWDQIGGRS